MGRRSVFFKPKTDLRGEAFRVGFPAELFGGLLSTRLRISDRPGWHPEFYKVSIALCGWFCSARRACKNVGFVKRLPDTNGLPSSLYYFCYAIFLSIDIHISDADVSLRSFIVSRHPCLIKKNHLPPRGLGLPAYVLNLLSIKLMMKLKMLRMKIFTNFV